MPDRSRSPFPIVIAIAALVPLGWFMAVQSQGYVPARTVANATPGPEKVQTVGAYYRDLTRTKVATAE